MRHIRHIVLATVILSTGAVMRPASAEVRREKTERRPYITEIGEPQSIGTAALQREAEKTNDMRDFFLRHGYPDYAEVQEIVPEWPWESYEVRTYYMHWNLEVTFGRVPFSEAMPDLGVLKFQSEIPPEKRHAIEVILEARVAPAAPPAPDAVPAAPPPTSEAPPPSAQPSAENPASTSGPEL
jgi:hypothetical protein